jgi:DNA-binding transcriptional ArsR family regulator
MLWTEQRQRDEPDPDDVFQALEDRTCREIITELDEPKTVAEIAESCEIPLSTTYRKVERLDKASLVTQRTEIRHEGHHRARYRVNFATIIVLLSQDHSLELEIERPRSDPKEGLVTLWSELRRETQT